PPTGRSWLLRVVHGVRVKDSVFSSFSSRHRASSRQLLTPLTQKAWHPCDSQWRARPIFSRLSTLLLIPPPVVCVSTSPASAGLLVNVFQVPGFSFSTFSAS